MTKSAVGYASDLRRTCVGQSVGPLGLVFLAIFALGAPAQAGAWEEFERRCLMPMENVALAEPDDLPLGTTLRLKKSNQLARMYSPDDQGFTLAIADKIDGSETHIGCWVAVGGVLQSFGELHSQFETWARKQIEAGRYEQVEIIGTRIVEPILQSVLFREPKMRVFVRHYPATGSVTLEALETDLES